MVVIAIEVDQSNIITNSVVITIEVNQSSIITKFIS